MVDCLSLVSSMESHSTMDPELPIAGCGSGDVAVGGLSSQEQDRSGVSCSGPVGAEVVQYSDEDFLSELLTPPAPSQFLAGDVSDDDFLGELLKVPEGFVPGSLQILRDSQAEVARQGMLCGGSTSPTSTRDPRPQVAGAARGLYGWTSSGGESCPAPKHRLSGRRGDIPCHGCPDEMMEQHARAMVSASLRQGQIVVEGLRVMIRDGISDFSPPALEQVALRLQERLIGVLEQCGICIFKIGIARDPVYRMFNSGYGYAVCGEVYSSMTLLMVSFPAVCAYLERALIHIFQSQAGCRNMAPGGESAPKSGLCYVYVVTQPCGDGKPIRKRKGIA